MTPGSAVGTLPSGTGTLLQAASPCSVSLFRLVNTHSGPVTITVRSTGAGGASAALAPLNLSLDPGFMLDLFSDGEVLALAAGETITGVASVAGVIEFRI